METNSTHQEILLFTGTRFSSRQWAEKDDNGKPNSLSQKEQLEEACWNGLLPEMLPELSVYAGGKKLFLWNIREAKSFIELELGEEPLTVVKQFSIDPYVFMETQTLN
jgi:hypothetical protein